MSEPVITVENLSKRYWIRRAGSRGEVSLRDEFSRKARLFARKAAALAGGRNIGEDNSLEEFWALKDVSFEVKRGEVLGIIGRNGAGKSTLLKILSRITEPTAGRMRIGGQVASLLEVGTGFHSELTGRENVYLNGAMLGMTRAEIRRKFDEIVGFAAVEKFIDVPVKRYSSGMYVRLGFAVAAHVDPEILIIDEALAVGDAQFQKKCLRKMREIAGSGRTVIFVSHNLDSVLALCKCGILLDAGRIEFFGNIHEAVSRYSAVAVNTEPGYNFDILPNPWFQPVSAWTSDLAGNPASAFDSDEAFNVTIRYSASKIVPDCRIRITVSSSDGAVLFTSSVADRASNPPLQMGEHLLECEIPRNLLAPGHYVISFYGDIPGHEMMFRGENMQWFAINEQGAVGGTAANNRPGLLRLALQWRSRPVSTPVANSMSA